MVKHYCDVCGEELTEKNKPNGSRLSVSKVFKNADYLEHKSKI